MICGRAAGQVLRLLTQLTFRSSRVRFAASDGGSYDYATAVAAALPGLTQALDLMKKRWRQLSGILIGTVIAPVALLAAIVSADAGHGDFLLAKILFPYSLLLTRLAGDTITDPLIGLALIQFPLYGLAATSFSTARPKVYLLALHTICAILCFSGLLPNFV